MIGSNHTNIRMMNIAGRQFAERVLTNAQNDCYFGLVLLEWARLLKDMQRILKYWASFNSMIGSLVGASEVSRGLNLLK